MHKWLYKYNQYFNLEEIPEADKLKLASYYLDGMALYWHQNYTRNLEGNEVTWAEYVDALCCRFGGSKGSGTHRTQGGGKLEEYIRDFDVLWNKAQISKKQALVFFLGRGEWLKRAMFPKLSFRSGGRTYHSQKQLEKKPMNLIGGSLNLTLRTRLKSWKRYCHEWKRKRK